MVRRTSTLRRRGLTAYKVHELLMGRIKYPLRGYGGYGDMLLDQGRDSFTENYITDACARTGKRTVMRLWLSGAAVRAPMPTILPSLASTSACFPGCPVRLAQYLALGGEAVRHR